MHLARTFELVEGEKGKIKATSILCNMFRRFIIWISFMSSIYFFLSTYLINIHIFLHYEILLLNSLLALSPEDVLPAVYLCTNKIAADHENLVSLFLFSFGGIKYVYIF